IHAPHSSSWTKRSAKSPSIAWTIPSRRPRSRFSLPGFLLCWHTGSREESETPRISAHPPPAGEKRHEEASEGEQQGQVGDQRKGIPAKASPQPREDGKGQEGKPAEGPESRT